MGKANCILQTKSTIFKYTRIEIVPLHRVPSPTCSAVLTHQSINPRCCNTCTHTGTHSYQSLAGPDSAAELVAWGPSLSKIQLTTSGQLSSFNEMEKQSIQRFVLASAALEPTEAVIGGIRGEIGHYGARTTETSHPINPKSQCV